MPVVCIPGGTRLEYRSGHELVSLIPYLSSLKTCQDRLLPNTSLHPFMVLMLHTIIQPVKLTLFLHCNLTVILYGIRITEFTFVKRKKDDTNQALQPHQNCAQIDLRHPTTCIIRHFQFRTCKSAEITFE
jgi:hypothetical protein